MNFEEIGMDIPLRTFHINNKPTKGEKKKTQPSLQFQPSDCTQSIESVIIELYH